MIAGVVVAGLLLLVYGWPSESSKSESPLVVAPASQPQLIPDQPRTNSFQLIPERVQEPKQLVADEATPGERSDPETVESGAEWAVENATILEQQQPEEDETIPEEQPAAGEWQNRGAKLKQGRKLTIRASQLMQRGRYAEAGVLLNEAVNMFPQKTRDLSYGEALYKLGICLRKKGQPEEAIPVLREAMQFPYYRSKVLREVEAATGQLERRAKVNQTRG